MASLVVGTIYFGLMFILAGFFFLLAMIFPKKTKEFLITAGGVLILFIFIIPLQARLSLKIQEKREAPKKAERKAKYEEARTVFDEQCKKAGEKIYRTVDNVDGVMLLKVRESAALHRNNPMFEDAVLAPLHDVGGMYIATLLDNSNLKSSEFVKKRYEFIDVLKKDNNISRYLEYKGYGGEINEEQDGVIIKNPSEPARYAVTYENNVDPELRKHWVAGTTIKIIDRQTNELLAEKTIFAFARTMGNYSHGAWVDSRMDFCPEDTELGRYPTSHFVVTVLKP